MSIRSSTDVPFTKASAFWPHWLIASGLGWIVAAWASTRLLHSLLEYSKLNTFDGPSFNTVFVSLLHGLIMGIIIGGFQYFVLRCLSISARFWITANAIGWALAYMAGSWAAWSVYHNSPTAIDVEVTGIAATILVEGPCVDLSLAIWGWSRLKTIPSSPIKWFFWSAFAWSLPLMIYSAYIYLTFTLPMAHGFIPFGSIWLRLAGDLISAGSIILYNSLGFMAGAISYARIWGIKNLGGEPD